MITKWTHRTALLASLLFGAVATIAGCESKGPAQQAGENVDKGIQSAKDTVNPPSTSEKVGRSVDKALAK
jgi:predicted small lipoprotein YifL